MRTNVFIHNTYYYGNSKSLGKNAVAIVMTLHKRTIDNLLDYKFKLIGSNSTLRKHSLATLSIEEIPNARCDYVMTLALSNTVDNMEKLEIAANGVSTIIPFKPARTTAPRPIVFCISPQFVAEEWQAFLVQVHVSRRFGAHLHIYLLSIIDSYYDLMKEYEKMGDVTLDQWLTIKFQKTDDPYLEPNGNVELRNQAAAQTDCLLQYKEAVEFIGFLDMDDILIPHNAKNYHEEFRREFDAYTWMNALIFQKTDFETVKVNSLVDQTIGSIVKNAKLLPSKDLGKPIVKPEYYNSTWIHFSIDDQIKAQKLRSENPNARPKQRRNSQTNAIFHLKTLKFIDVDRLATGAIPSGLKDNSTKLIDETTLAEIDAELKTLQSTPNFREISQRLPKDEFYRKIVYQCYFRNFYRIREMGKLQTKELCINAYNCELPQRDDLKCIHSDASYHSGPTMSPFTFHWQTSSFFSPHIGSIEPMMEYGNFGYFLIPSALIGVVCNWTVVFSMLKIASLKQSFGYLTANQALGDAIHCTAFLFYVCVMMIFDIELFLEYSKHCGFVLIFCYELSVLSHLIISFNRFAAIYMPIRYPSMFSIRNTSIIIAVMWITTATLTIYFYQVLCPIFYDPSLIMFSLRFSDFCETLTWYTDFWKFIVCISLVVVFDTATVAKVHTMNRMVRGFNDSKTNESKRKREMVFLKQTCFQGIAFVSELISYFIVPIFYADNKIILFFLTTFAWVSVHCIDGVITVICNPELRNFITLSQTKRNNATSSSANAHTAPPFVIKTDA
ncbi:unnamed protein product [Caenorhabditis bovis]|uniref:G-protein coupled receptors family 1 profile domain-containing protein n=1 Tax=Caenorhabditis bovis TaxID=2654633 RepID=A0A8S1DZB7_9PELO|nr:unnamed protein product [Caenorhabditis bovis]